MTPKCGWFPALLRLELGGVKQVSRCGEAQALEEPAPAMTIRSWAAKVALTRSVALVGMMGAGKSSVGRRLADALGVPFHDADCEIEAAAGRPIPEIFATHGEAEFRRGERQVMARLLRQPICVLATGGGAVLDASTRDLLRENAFTIWLRADIETILRRVERRDTRPLLRTADPRSVLSRLLAEREPLYAQADAVVDSGPGSPNHTVEACLKVLAGRFPIEQSEPA